jgi:hypothetical protein
MVISISGVADVSLKTGAFVAIGIGVSSVRFPLSPFSGVIGTVIGASVLLAGWNASPACWKQPDSSGKDMSKRA